MRRISGRRVHEASGRSYHIDFNPPRKPDIDDETGEALVQRDDDREETIKRRLAVYHGQTEPLIKYYSEWSASGESYKHVTPPAYIRVNGLGAVEDVSAAIISHLQSIQPADQRAHP